jgi:ribosomal protein S18 acetylase RimI-like enzyme
MIVRPVTERDIGRVAEVKVRNWRDTYAGLVPAGILGPFLDEGAQAGHLREDLARPATLFLVAEDSGEVIGFALTYVDAEPEPWLESLHVSRERRGRGAGAALVRATAAGLVAQARRSLRLGVVAGNDGAKRFYERLGAEHAGREPAAWAPSVWHEIYRWADLSVASLLTDGEQGGQDLRLLS